MKAALHDMLPVHNDGLVIHLFMFASLFIRSENISRGSIFHVLTLSCNIEHEDGFEKYLYSHSRRRHNTCFTCSR